MIRVPALDGQLVDFEDDPSLEDLEKEEKELGALRQIYLCVKLTLIDLPPSNILWRTLKI